MVELVERVLLNVNILDFLLANNVSLVEHLDRIVATVGQVECQYHL